MSGRSRLIAGWHRRGGALIILYDAQKCDWNEVLEKAWASRPPGEVGMIVAIPKGGRMHREMTKHNDSRSNAGGRQSAGARHHPGRLAEQQNRRKNDE